MAHSLESLIDQIVQRAQQRGELDDLPSAGKPLVHPENPEEAVLLRLMKEADATSPVVVLRRQIIAAQDVLKTLAGDDERKAKMHQIAELQTKLAIEMEAFRKYG